MHRQRKPLNLALATIAFVIGIGLTGCAGPQLNPKYQFVTRNPELAQSAAELYQISIDHWVELEWSGLGGLGRSALTWGEKNITQITDAARQEEARRRMSILHRRATVRYIDALMGLHEVRSKMTEGDHLFYCRPRDEFSGALYIVRNGRIKQKLLAGYPWEDIAWEALWDEVRAEPQK